MTTLATLAYSAKVVSPNTIGKLAALMASIDLNYGSFPLGASLVSDITTSSGSSTVTRTVVLSFFAKAFYYPVTDHSEQPAVVKGSANLNTLIYGGGGSLDGQTLTITYAGSDVEVEMTFVAPLTPAAAVAQVTSAFGPSVVASEDPVTHGLILTTLAEGPSASITIIGGTAVATLGLTLATDFGIAANPFRGSIVSSSSNDTANGSGLQTVRINYIDDKGNPNFDDASMNGTTPVSLTSPNKATIVSIVPITGTPAGLITVYTNNSTTKVVNYPPNGQTLEPGTPTNLFTTPYASGDRAGQLLNNFTGTLVSTSDNDSSAPGATGATSVTINYLDKLGNPLAQVVALNGTTPVVLPSSDHATIVSVIPNLPNTGIISIYTGDTPLSTGAPAATVPASFVARFPIGTDQSAPFWDLYTHTLANGLGSVVTAAAPVLS